MSHHQPASQPDYPRRRIESRLGRREEGGYLHSRSDGGGPNVVQLIQNEMLETVEGGVQDTNSFNSGQFQDSKPNSPSNTICLRSILTC